MKLLKILKTTNYLMCKNLQTFKVMMKIKLFTKLLKERRVFYINYIKTFKYIYELLVQRHKKNHYTYNVSYI